MKKSVTLLLLIYLVLCCVFSAGAEDAGEYYDDYEGGYMAVVANPRLSDRLNLREKPDAASKSLGRMYSGTPVYVFAGDPIQDKEGNEWVRVDLLANFEAGVDLKGYMRKDYLMPMNSNFEAPQLFHKASAPSRTNLLSEPRNGASVVARVGQENLYLLGDIGDDWRLAVTGVGKSAVVGYVRASRLTHTWVEVQEAYAIPLDRSGSVTVWADREMKKAGAVLYSGAPVRISGYSRNEGWVSVECWGTRPIFEHKWQADISGYVRAEDIVVFIQPWQAEMRLRTGIAKAEFEMKESGIIIPRGASVTVVGEMKDKYLIVCGDAANLWYGEEMISADLIQVTDRLAGAKGPEALGYAWLGSSAEDTRGGWYTDLPVSVYPGKTDKTETSNRLAEIIGEVEKDGIAYWQLRSFDYPNFYVPKENCSAWLRSENDSAGSKALPHSGNDTFIASSSDQGMWNYVTQPGQAGRLTLTKAGRKTETYAAPADAETETNFAFYLEAGTQVQLEGTGMIHPLVRHVGPQLLPAYPENYAGNTVIFEGSGRFFCDWQYPDCMTYFTLTVAPMEDSGDSYVIESNLFSSGEAPGTQSKTCFFPEPEKSGEEQTQYVTDWGDLFEVWMQPGMFLEVHNCVLTINFGNG